MKIGTNPKHYKNQNHRRVLNLEKKDHLGKILLMSKMRMKKRKKKNNKIKSKISYKKHNLNNKINFNKRNNFLTLNL